MNEGRDSARKSGKRKAETGYHQHDKFSPRFRFPLSAFRLPLSAFPLASFRTAGYNKAVAMPDANVSQRLQKTIVLYSAVGMLVVGVAVGIVGVLPLARQLREAQRRNLMVDL